VWFGSATNAVFSIDSASGRITALAAGGPLPFTAHADTVSATGAVEVVQLTDTIGGKGSFTILGTAIRRARAGARAVTYRRQADTATFRIALNVAGGGGSTVENVVITLRDSVAVPKPDAIDSMSLNEAFGSSSDFLCRPLRSYGVWSIQTSPPLTALSRHGGAIAITKVATVAHGRAVSGRFSFTAQRVDFYGNPLAALPIRGTFVAPLIADNSRRCG
jgi:hypothetical protein